MTNPTIATPTRPWWQWLLRRWPTALALLLSALTLGGSGTDEGVRSFAHVLGLLPLLYLVVAKLEKRRATWPLLVTGLAAVIGLRVLDLIPLAAVWWAIALVVLVWGAFDGHLAKSGTLRVQALGMLIFGGLGLLGLIVDPELARYLIAAGWFFHGVWDFVHLKLDRVVARSFAEWCGVVDIVVAAELLLYL
ncbi:hypothetical protein [Stackebrandtia nassauensis]|uniref:Uncharacterized protein n=1 Tax=Stackebrandtia nassauensis (strain DSM 44728 / CIP 108903 / NRRL B-16338 / NBRC 102104 / LLR-40K-21) TaxID=446470 RepID=D3Q340_STANL|nr:hypothetical protein [Stackebrandtia nassauensis]ADD40010.1 hypothetical protein Snas_0292 [Stackebrandtia nassauensis DSM 44728]